MAPKAHKKKKRRTALCLAKPTLAVKESYSEKATAKLLARFENLLFLIFNIIFSSSVCQFNF